MECDFYSGIGRNWFAIFRSRIELPGLHRLDGFFIQSEADAAGDFNVPRNAVSSHDQAKNHRTLIFGFASFFRILRIGRIGSLGSAYAATDTKHSATDTTAAAFTNARASTDAYT